MVIGRNEAKRLSVCLKSFQGLNCPVIYVDSGSTDSSVTIANSMPHMVWQLDTMQPFSAARARNEGLNQLISTYPQLQYIQFIDGDCEVSAQWVKSGQEALQQDEKIAIVFGHLHEAYPDKSVYNQLCALEWQSAAGDLTNFGAIGGIFMMRVDVFKFLNGFNAKVIAGEDSELGIRVGLAGYKITKLDASMATHDANILSFNQWWTRAVRAGHAVGQRAFLNGDSKMQDCVKERKSTFFWGIILPLLALLLLIPTKGFSLLILLCAFTYLGTRIYQYRRKIGNAHELAFLYTKFTVLGKLANGFGLIKFYINKFKKNYQIIEYK